MRNPNFHNFFYTTKVKASLLRETGLKSDYFATG